MENFDEILTSTDVPFIPEAISVHEMALSTNFDQVIFPDIPDFFPPENDVTVEYILTSAITPSSRDWLGLFRVGWASPRDYTTYVWAPKPKSEEDRLGKQSVSFQASRLPGDDKEFYQFCYVTKRGYVRGASTPFQFRVCTENDCLIECEDETGMIILKTKSDALEEKLTKITEEKEELEKNVVELESARQVLNSELKKIHKELACANKEIKQEKTNNEELDGKFLALKADHEKVLKRLSKADTRIETTKSQLNEAKQLINTLEEEQKGLRCLIADLEEKQNQQNIDHKQEIVSRDVKLQQCEVVETNLKDQIRTLSVVRDEIQQKSSDSAKEKEDLIESLRKEKENVSVKLARYRDERNLFKDQFTQAEMTRQENVKTMEALKCDIEEMKKEVVHHVEEIKSKNEKIKESERNVKAAQKKLRDETNNFNNLLRSSLENVSTTETAKKLLATELTEATNARDKLMVDLNKARKEKESLVKELKGERSKVTALQCQLVTLEERLTTCEIGLVEKDEDLIKERRRAEEAEMEMHDKIMLLRQQLEESDTAFVSATAIATETKTKRTQTKPAQKSDATTATKNERENEQDFVITDLKSQVEDLTTRLSMGADAYKEKFVECHRLEKKLKKMKQSQGIEKPSGSKPQASKEEKELKTGDEEGGEGIMTKLEKLFMAIADPDAEEQVDHIFPLSSELEQARQLQNKILEMERDLQSQIARGKKYKTLYSDEKQKAADAELALTIKENELILQVNDLKENNLKVVEENQMLKSQLQEFVAQSTDSNVKNMMVYNTASSSNEDTADGYTNRSRTLRDLSPDDEGNFEDAPGYPMVTSYPRGSHDFPVLSSYPHDMESSESDGIEGAAFANFNMCTESNNDKKVAKNQPTSKPIACKSSRIVNRQPIRSPPLISDVITAVDQSTTSSGSSPPESRKKNARNKKKKSKKSVRNGAM